MHTLNFVNLSSYCCARSWRGRSWKPCGSYFFVQGKMLAYTVNRLIQVKRDLYSGASYWMAFGEHFLRHRGQQDVSDWFMADLDWCDEILRLLLLGGGREDNRVRLIHIITQSWNRSPRICTWGEGPLRHCLARRACPDPVPTTAGWSSGCSKILALASIFGILKLLVSCIPSASLLPGRRFGYTY